MQVQDLKNSQEILLQGDPELTTYGSRRRNPRARGSLLNRRYDCPGSWSRERNLAFFVVLLFEIGLSC